MRMKFHSLVESERNYHIFTKNSSDTTRSSRNQTVNTSIAEVAVVIFDNYAPWMVVLRGKKETSWVVHKLCCFGFGKLLSGITEFYDLDAELFV